VTGLHVGIVMDGNGRWAEARGLARVAGHREGAKALRRVVEAAPGAGITTLTVFAFSADNWRRPADEVAWLMRLFRAYLRGERRACVEQGVAVRVIGRRDRLPADLIREVEATELATAGCRRLTLRVAVDYSARDTILRAAEAAPARLTRAAFERRLDAAAHAGPAPALDLLIRTGGEQRLSDFLLWECAYAELYFTRLMWPEFGATDLARAVAEFRRRDRRFGGLPAPAVEAGAA